MAETVGDLLVKLRLDSSGMKYTGGDPLAKLKSDFASGTRSIQSDLDKTQANLNKLKGTTTHNVKLQESGGGVLSRIKSELASLKDKVVNVTVRQQGGTTAATGKGGGMGGIGAVGSLALGAVGGMAAGGVMMGVQAIGGLVGGATDYLSTIEQSNIAFGVMTDQSDSLMKSLKDMAAATPFEFPELASAGKKALAMGMAVEDIPDILKKAGNAASAMGTGAQGIDTIVTSLGRMSQSGKVSLENLNLMNDMGVPAIKYLAAGFLHAGDASKVTQDDIAKMYDSISDGSLDARKAVTYLKQGMEQDFGGMMEKQSKTFSGLMSTLKDTVNETLGTALKPAFEWVSTTGLPMLISGLGTVKQLLTGELDFKTWMAGIDWVGIGRTAGDLLGKAIVEGVKLLFSIRNIIAEWILGMAPTAEGGAKTGGETVGSAFASSMKTQLDRIRVDWDKLFAGGEAAAKIVGMLVYNAFVDAFPDNILKKALLEGSKFTPEDFVEPRKALADSMGSVTFQPEINMTETNKQIDAIVKQDYEVMFSPTTDKATQVAVGNELDLIARSREAINRPNVDTASKNNAEAILDIVARAREVKNNPLVDEAKRSAVDTILNELAHGRITPYEAQARLGNIESVLDAAAHDRTVNYYTRLVDTGNIMGSSLVATGASPYGTPNNPLNPPPHTGGIAGVGVFHGGAAYASVPRFHTGYGLKNDEILSVLQKGERIFSVDDNRKLEAAVHGGGRGGNTTIINVNGIKMEDVANEIMRKLNMRAIVGYAKI